MSKKFLVSLTVLTLALHLGACTSGDEKSDVEAVQDAEAFGDGSAPAADAPATGDAAMTSDALPEDALNSAPTEETAKTDVTADPNKPAEPTLDGAEQVPVDAAGNTPPADGLSLETPPAPVDPNATVTENPPPAPADMTPSSTEASAPPALDEKPKVQVSLQKMAAKPWKVGKTWFNGVYFARPGDNLKAISKKIYGENKTSMLKKGNPQYASRQPKPGDKVYYNSPKRPDDSEQMLTYFEETNAPAENYVAKAGDNIRKVSKDLLGYDNAWKEVWASNAAVESKGELSEGTQLRYWKDAPIAMNPAGGEAPVAHQDAPTNAEHPPAPDMAQAPPPPMPDQGANGGMPPPPPPPQDMSGAAAGTTTADLPPPPPMPEQHTADLPPPPPPAPPVEAVPPPPPPIAAESGGGHGERKKKGPAAEEEPTAMNDETVMYLGAAAIAAAGIAGMMVMRRRRRQREMEAQIGESTQVGT